jgi:hypothetical protein
MLLSFYSVIYVSFRSILKSMSEFYVTDISTTNLCHFFKFWNLCTFSNCQTYDHFSLSPIDAHKEIIPIIYDRLRSASELKSAFTDLIISNQSNLGVFSYQNPFQILRSMANLLIRCLGVCQWHRDYLFVGTNFFVIVHFIFSKLKHLTYNSRSMTSIGESEKWS